ncbi:MAG: FtsX-like permease family protein [bacterium]
MLSSNLKIAFRNLWRSKGYSIINITGFAVGIASVLLLTLFIRHQLSYDRFNKNADRIVLADYDFFWGGEWKRIGEAQPGFGPAAVQEFSQVEDFVRVRHWGEAPFRVGEKTFLEDADFADPSFFRIFTVDVIAGDPLEGLKWPNTTALSQSTADRLFGGQTPVGKTIYFDGKTPFEVVAVYKDLPSKSYLRPGLLLSMETFRTPDFAWGDFDLLYYWNTFNFPTYLLLSDGADWKALDAQLPDFIQRHYTEDVHSEMKPRLVPLVDLHLQGDYTRITIFALVGAFILAIAIMNFINLTTARSAQRAREIGLRKVMGGTRRALIVQFLGESILVTLFATLLGLFLAELLLPWFSHLADSQFSIPVLSDPLFLPSMLLFAVLVGVLAGIYPAFVLASHSPARALKGNAVTGRAKSGFRRLLVLTQFALTLAMIAGTVTVYRQLHYLQRRDIGFDRENLIYIRMRAEDVKKQAESLKADMKKDPRIVSASIVSRMIGAVDGGGWSIETPAMRARSESMGIFAIFGDADLEATLGLKPLWGRTFMADDEKRNDGYLINKAAAEAVGLDPDSDPRMTIYGGGPFGEVVGILDNFNFRPLYNNTEPVVIGTLRPDNMFDRRYIALRISPGPVDEVIQHLRTVWKKYEPGMELEYTFLDDALENQYRAESRLSEILAGFSGLALVVAALGLLGLTAYITERRKKEIGVRKVLGAGVPRIVGLMVRDFTIPVLIANVFAWPATLFYLRHWLGNFPYHVDLTLAPFVGIGTGVPLVSLMVVVAVTWRTANLNPITTLRYE